MADKKISELNSLTGANAADGDLVAIVDVSATETKKITRSEFFTNVPSIDVTGSVGIGTSSPTAKLDVQVSSDTWEVVKVQNSGGSRASLLRMIGAAGGSVDFGADGGTASTAVIRTAGTERLRLDSSGNLGLGVTPSAWGSSVKVAQVSNASIAGQSNQALFSNNAFFDGAGWKYISSAVASQYYLDSNAQHQWLTAASGTAGNAITFTQAMTLDSSGNLLVGATSNSGMITGSEVRTGFGAEGGGTFYNQVNAGPNLYMSKASGYSNGVFQSYYTAGVERGSISYNGSAIVYATSSDYRLKENVQPMTGALDTVAQLNPVTYTWKADGSAGQGFIAHELQAVVPDCVTRTKDAVDAEGNPQYQGVDTSFLVGILTKAIQEQQTTIAALEARITALEA
jgi:hypothetical protein